MTHAVWRCSVFVNKLNIVCLEDSLLGFLSIYLIDIVYIVLILSPTMKFLLFEFIRRQNSGSISLKAGSLAW